MQTGRWKCATKVSKWWLNFQLTTNMEMNYISWKPPTLGFFKINVDASFVEAIKAASVGWLSETIVDKLSSLIEIRLELAIVSRKHN